MTRTVGCYTMNDLSRWLDGSHPGDVLVYHRGHLGKDRGRNRTLGKIAWFLSDLAGIGLVHLVQRRVMNEGEPVFAVWDYEARRAAMPGLSLNDLIMIDDLRKASGRQAGGGPGPAG